MKRFIAIVVLLAALLAVRVYPPDYTTLARYLAAGTNDIVLIGRSVTDHVHADYLAAELISPTLKFLLSVSWLRELSVAIMNRSGLTYYTAMRTRVLDDAVRNAVQQDGVQQVVVLGSGFDSRAYRSAQFRSSSSSSSSRLHWTEVDRPEVIHTKRSRMEQHFPHLKDTVSVTYVAANLMNTSIADILKQDPEFHFGEPTLFIAEGLLNYLLPATVEHIFGSIPKVSGPNSLFAFTLLHACMANQSCDNPNIDICHLRTKEQEIAATKHVHMTCTKGEPNLWGIDTRRVDDLRAFVGKFGGVVEKFIPSQELYKVLEDAIPDIEAKWRLPEISAISVVRFQGDKSSSAAAAAPGEKVAAAAATAATATSSSTAPHKFRSVKSQVTGEWQGEGDGARVRRSIGRPGIGHLDPFLLLDEFSVVPPAGFPDHPHRGFETVTYMLKGKFMHEDFMGNKGTIGPGDLQWMTAGKGIVHAEMPATSEENHGLQLWVNLARENKLCEPAYQELRADQIPEAEQNGVKVRVIAGKALGIESPVYTRTPTMYLDFLMQPDSSLEQNIPSGWNGFVYILDGSLVVGKSGVLGTAHQTLTLTTDGDTLQVRTPKDSACHFVLIAGQPLNEPIVNHGPFVMTTKEEIQEAINDYRGGRNGFEKARNFQSSISHRD